MTLKFFNYARELIQAEEMAVEIKALTDRNKNLTVQDAYQIQLESVKLKTEQGKRVIGKKVGLTNKAMQQMLNIDEPDYGHLFEDMKVNNGDTVNVDSMIAPRVEAEIGFVLKEDLRGPDITFLDVIMATDYVVPTIEIIDSRIADWKIELVDTVADNGSSAKVVIGQNRKSLDEINLRTNGMILMKNKEIVTTGSGSAALGHPAEAIAWLANKLSEFDIVLKKGELILPGALSFAVPVSKGDKIVADFGVLGKVSVLFK
ncbi:2-keto-4-pentenoate hydratase [Oceanobacillus sp. Castelsardo]|uniref:2-keto-4-pentenoate hydratase n=1 Tax=Oceanobacillus sp. Castelsardo TaxID=1851204 RepID=UPI000838EEE9|nr:2-keto-4-pentenoate hydratase [Oceanobacillus sp. Castelsardo]